MAFTGRAARQTAHVLSATSTEVGPGSYVSEQRPSARPSFAPFASTSLRGLGNSDSTLAPGPGAYISLDSRSVGSVSKSRVSSSCFTSAVPRFHHGITDTKAGETPGPGAYSSGQHSAWAKRRTFGEKQTQEGASSARGNKQSQQQNQPGAVKWVRLPTAPSIPVPRHSFGYDENLQGELVARSSTEKVYAGEKGDTIGPNRYNPHLTSNSRVVNFAQSKTKRMAFVDNGSVPGPGEYDPANPSGSKYRRKPFKQPAIFSSSKDRWHTTNQTHEALNPGPGSYSYQDSFDSAARELPARLQNFGSTVGRNGSVEARRPATSPSSSPGPGTHNICRSSFQSPEEVATKAAALGLPRPAPFTSTSRRFQQPDDDRPGPGSYEPQTSKDLVDEMDRKVTGRYGVFGTTTRRFHRTAPDRSPGPGSYQSKQPQQQTRGRLLHARPSGFQSRTKRFAHKIDETPGPVYQVGVSWQKGYSFDNKPGPGGPVQKSGAFGTGVKRFDSQDRQLGNAGDQPGPGYYESGRKSAGKSVTSSFKSRKARFGHQSQAAKAAQTPGPGSFHNPSYNPLIKRSFNISIDTEQIIGY